MSATEDASDAAASESELLHWRMRVDDFMDDAKIQRRMTAMQMGALESSVLELQGDVRESSELTKKNNEWSQKNHEALTNMVGFFEGMENLRKLADTAVKWGKPFLLLASLIGALLFWAKTGEWRAP